MNTKFFNEGDTIMNRFNDYVCNVIFEGTLCCVVDEKDNVKNYKFIIESVVKDLYYDIKKSAQYYDDDDYDKEDWISLYKENLTSSLDCINYSEINLNYDNVCDFIQDRDVSGAQRILFLYFERYTLKDLIYRIFHLLMSNVIEEDLELDEYEHVQHLYFSQDWKNVFATKIQRQFKIARYRPSEYELGKRIADREYDLLIKVCD